MLNSSYYSCLRIEYDTVRISTSCAILQVWSRDLGRNSPEAGHTTRTIENRRNRAGDLCLKHPTINNLADRLLALGLGLARCPQRLKSHRPHRGTDITRVAKVLPQDLLGRLPIRLIIHFFSNVVYNGRDS